MLLLQITLGIAVVSLSVAILLPIIGWFLPQTIAIGQSHSYFLPPDSLSKQLLHLQDYTRWRPQVNSIRILSDTHKEWEECYGNGQCITYRAQIQDEAHFIQQYSIRSSGPFKVNRIYKIWEQDNMSFVKVEDEIVIPSPPLRSLAFLFYNHKKYLQAEIRAFDQFVQST